VEVPQKDTGLIDSDSEAKSQQVFDRVRPATPLRSRHQADDGAFRWFVTGVSARETTLGSPRL
jgi:hypothetical protein